MDVEGLAGRWRSQKYFIAKFQAKKKQVDVTGLALNKLAADLDLVFIYMKEIYF